MWFLINAYFHVGAIMYSIYIYLLFIIATLPRINSFEEIGKLSYINCYRLFVRREHGLSVLPLVHENI